MEDIVDGVPDSYGQDSYGVYERDGGESTSHAPDRKLIGTCDTPLKTH
jgi:hypothetical protein